MNAWTLTSPQSDLSPDRLERWLERWGGWLVAGFIHLALLAFFSNQQVIFERIIKPKEPLSIRFQLPDPPPPAADVALPAQPVLLPPSFEQAVATVADPDVETADNPAQAQSAPDAADDSTPADEPSGALAAVAPAALGLPVLPNDLTEQLDSELQRLRRLQARQQVEQNRVRTEVHKLEAEAKGRRFTLDSDGGRQGAIRTLNVSQIPDDVVAKVFRTYHIQIRRNTPPSEAKPAFLNAAVTEEGTFRNVPVTGPTDVFILSPTAISMMSRLESEALVKRGFDPRRTRVLEIRFGIIKNDVDEWDLGVTHLETEALP